MELAKKKINNSMIIRWAKEYKELGLTGLTSSILNYGEDLNSMLHNKIENTNILIQSFKITVIANQVLHYNIKNQLSIEPN